MKITKDKFIKILIPILTTLIVAIIINPSKPINDLPLVKPTTGRESAIVKRVVDGDTFELDNGSKVRLIGIDAPEDPLGKTPDCFAKESFQFLKELVEGKSVTLAKDINNKDKYGRLLRYVFLDPIFVNEILVKKGFAKATPYPPDVLHQEGLSNAEKEAITLAKGLWGCR